MRRISLKEERKIGLSSEEGRMYSCTVRVEKAVHFRSSSSEKDKLKGREENRATLLVELRQFTMLWLEVAQKKVLISWM